MSIFANLDTSADIKEDNDSVGGFSTLDSNAYLFTIEYAFVTLAASKAMALNLHLTGANGEKLRQQFYMTSGEAKGCLNYYINKKNEKHYLPGFNQANALCLLTVGEPITKLNTEKKTINLYDFDAGKELPTEVDMLMPVIGKQIIAGVLKQTVDKRIKDASTGAYVPSGETKEENEIDKLFRVSDKLTVLEIKAQETEPVFLNKWMEKWKGKVKNKATKTGATPGAPGKRPTGAQAPVEQLFG